MRIALTIDTEHPDHPCRPGGPERLLDALATAGARATFFLQGRWTAANPAVARRIAGAGHVIGNHSNSHAPIPDMTDDGIRTSIADAAETIVEATGVDPKPWFRLPYGDGQDDPQIAALVAGLGYRLVGWDVDVNDWDPDRTAGEVVERVAEGCRDGGDGSIVVLHSWPDATSAALPELIGALRGLGADLVGIDEL